METNDRFSRQTGEDASAHFARLARDLWSCVDDVKRQVEQSRHDRQRDEAVRAERDTATVVWRENTSKRLQRLEDQVDTLRMAARAQASDPDRSDKTAQLLARVLYILIAGGVGLAGAVLGRDFIPPPVP